MTQPIPLKRNLSLFLTTFYGLGTILGAGIYVLVGKVAGISGLYAPFAFLIACLLATFSALSFSELSSRFPESSGEAVYIQQGLGIKWIAVGTGLLIALSGMVSAATLVHGFAGYFRQFFLVQDWVVITLVILVLGVVAVWGIKEAVWLATLITLVEISGLLIIVWIGRHHLMNLPENLPSLIPSFNFEVWGVIFSGAFVAFYAFIGFEDIVNVAEEVKNPTKNLPRAILFSLIGAAFLYVLVVLTAILVVDPQELSQHKAPLAFIYQTVTGNKPTLISLIGLFAVINGALVQIIMASRILYGMSRRGFIPSFLSSVNSKTKTPLVATALVVALILILGLGFPILTLAKTTSFFTLTVFALVNLSLCFIKIKKPKPVDAFTVPFWVPVVGTISSFGFIIMQVVR